MKTALIIGGVVVTGVVVFLIVHHIHKSTEKENIGNKANSNASPATRQVDASFNMTNNFGNPNKPVY